VTNLIDYQDREDGVPDPDVVTIPREHAEQILRFLLACPAGQVYHLIGLLLPHVKREDD